MNCVRNIDKDILRAGVAAGLEALESASSLLARMRAGEAAPWNLADILTCLHRAGRAAATVGLCEIGRSVQEVEAALERLQIERRGLAAGEVALIEEAIDLLTALLLSVNARTGVYSTDDGQGCLDRLKAACA